MLDKSNEDDNLQKGCLFFFAFAFTQWHAETPCYWIYKKKLLLRCTHNFQARICVLSKMRNYLPKRPSGAPLQTLIEQYDAPVGFVASPSFKLVKSFIYGCRRMVVVRYRMIRLVLVFTFVLQNYKYLSCFLTFEFWTSLGTSVLLITNILRLFSVCISMNINTDFLFNIWSAKKKYRGIFDKV